MSDQSHRNSVYGNIRAEMARRGVSQRALAHHLGMAQQSLSRRLTGEYRLSVDELQGIAEALGVPAAELLGAA